MAAQVLERLCRGPPVKHSVSPRVARSAVFLLAAKAAAPSDRQAVIAAAAQTLGARPEDVERCLFADLGDQARVGAPPPDLDPGALALRTNLALVRALLVRATRLELRVWGGTRAVVRLAKLLGLICTVRRQAEGVILDVSGPLALFHHVRVYGRALGSLLGPLAWCDRFALTGPCVLPEGELLLRLGPRDPIFLPGEEPRRFDSKVEEALTRDLTRLAPEWDVVREPEPLRVGDALIFPDLAIVHRLMTTRRFLIEIVGFWTAEYLARKLALLRQAEVPNLILCVDASRACGEHDLPEGARVVRYHRRVPAQAIVDLISAGPPTSA